MKCQKVIGDKFYFHIGKLEQRFFCSLLERYPIVPPGHFRITGTAREQLTEHQKLLDEFTAAHREENRRHVQAFLENKRRFRPDKQGLRFYVTSDEIQWLLQVINDIRVGCWLLLGSPDESKQQRTPVTEMTAPNLWAVQVSGHFQMALIEGFSKRSTAPRSKPAKSKKPRRKRRGSG